MTSETAVVLRILLGTALGFVLGFEREVRGSPAGDRTFSLVGAAATAITAVSFPQAPQVVGGVVTGIGFIGAGVVLHGQGTLVRGVTTAATVFVTAGVGVLAGCGRPWSAVVLTALVLAILEVRHVPGLRYLDAGRYRARFMQEGDPPQETR